MQTHILGYPRIGNQRELKKASEKYWAGKISYKELLETGKNLRRQNWQTQLEAGIDIIPCNDFSFYDQVLDMSLTLGAIPERYESLRQSEYALHDLYFAMARGFQKDEIDVTAMEMTKWFDTNYHYIVPEFKKDQSFSFFSHKVVEEAKEALELHDQVRPVLIGAISYLLMGKEKEPGFNRVDLWKKLLPVYAEILKELTDAGISQIQFDEPYLVMDLKADERQAITEFYEEIRKNFPDLSILVATYFGGLEDNLSTALSLPVDILHIDLVRAPEQLEKVLDQFPTGKTLSLGLVDGRNIWKNDFEHSLEYIKKAVEKLGTDSVMLAPSCSLLHVPCDLALETNEKALPSEVKQWMAYAKQKLDELVVLKKLANADKSQSVQDAYTANRQAMDLQKTSTLIHQAVVKDRVGGVKEADASRKSPFPVRKAKQKEVLHLPLFPTTTIGSFPQTKEVRGWRAAFKKGNITAEEYDTLLKKETEKTINMQKEIGIDVLVHGEFERNDMVEYFGEQLAGFAFSKFGWVQSYGSRCVKPPIIYGDVYRPKPMTVYWSEYAQSLTKKPVKGMLTGPVTILQWSFVRSDQPRSQTCLQIALAIRDEVIDLEKAGIKVIQIDEPAIREGLPLRHAYRPDYLKWAVNAFKVAADGVEDETQIHTHMCYSEFNDMIESIADMDADVITIECSRSQMELLDVFGEFKYPNDIGPGVYDIHSPRIPQKEEMVYLLKKAREVIPQDQLWVNPDCGLKTRKWEEVTAALKEMVDAAREMRISVGEPVAS